ncbi:hypothetical protein [Aquimarina algiphila]|uniref:Phage portal protein n=1 Tax=Aquimarina algiphila TaxID=2047982 RepID=A0A554VE67_9FLAO|nr:hypothetical protein [Aquimarina algiphila]TSE05256.1 hypothetical protein FOF46_23625 [Aquimarina algiphila]
MARAKIIELFTRLFPVMEKDNSIYYNGEDNNYPERIERLINNSVTAKLAANKMADFIIGKGFEGDINKAVINTKGDTFYTILKKIARSIAYQKSFFLHINYNIEGEPNYLDVIPVKKGRISKEDDFLNKGKIWVANKWEITKGFPKKSKEKKKWYYPYNPNLAVINAQRNKDFYKYSDNKKLVLTTKEKVDLKIEGYRGQVLFVNLEDENIYANAYIDPAYEDADTEYRISTFRNDNIRNGFIGATVATVAVDPDEDEAKITDEQLKSLLGAENSSNILKVEAEVDSNGKLKEVVKFETVKSEVDTKRFQYDEQKTEERQLNCFNNIPKILVKNSDSSLFGTSGEALKVAQEIYNQETEEERKTIEQTLNKIFKGVYPEFKIKTIIDGSTGTEV